MIHYYLVYVLIFANIILMLLNSWNLRKIRQLRKSYENMINERLLSTER